MKVRFHRTYVVYKIRESSFAAFIGLLAGLAAAALDAAIVNLHRLVYSEAFLPYAHTALLAVYASVAYSVENRFGTPGLLLALKYLQENLVVPAALWLFKFLGVVLSLSVLPVGREGPAAFLGTGLGQYLALLFRVPKGQLGYWGTVGAAAFVGAFLKTPLGATFYVFENRFGKVLNVDFVINALAAATVSYTVYVALRGAHPIIPVKGEFDWGIYDLLPAVVLGILTSGVAIAVKFLYELFKFSASLLDNWMKPLAVLPLIWLLLAVAQSHDALHLLELSVNYRPLEEVASTLHPPEVLLKAIVLEVLFLTALLSFGYPGGIILPLIFIGAALGNLVAHADPEKLPIFVLTGAAAMLCAAMNVPITAVVMIAEMSHRTLIVPEIVAVLTAYFLASSVKLLRR
ncbi:MAG: chloride channel protein [Aquificae bacterium]|nr:chloride channel protein [Aquificota bacterium]